MKPEFKYLMGALLIGALVCMPVMATDFLVKSADRGIATSFSITIAPGDQTMPLSVGTNTKTDGNAVSVTSNVGYTISAQGRADMQDATSNPEPTNKYPYMHPSVQPATWATATTLANAFEIGVNSDAYFPISSTPTVLHTGAGAETWNSNLKFRQVVTVTDKVLPTGQFYQIPLTVVGAAV